VARFRKEEEVFVIRLATEALLDEKGNVEAITITLGFVFHVEKCLIRELRCHFRVWSILWEGY